LADYGISRDQSSRWQKLAAVPDAEFEATFSAPAKPSTDLAAARLTRLAGASTCATRRNTASRLILATCRKADLVAAENHRAAEAPNRR
jgi:hypothetical protein